MAMVSQSQEEKQGKQWLISKEETSYSQWERNCELEDTWAPICPAQPGPGAITIRNLCVQGHSCFICPAPGNVTNGVATSSQHQHRQVETLHKLHTFGMPFGGTKQWVTGPPSRTLPTPSLCSPVSPLMVRLKQPNRSPDRESEPHCKTTALGWNISITLDMT